MNSGLNSKRRHRANAQFISIPARGGFMYGEGGGAYNQIFCPTRNSVIS